MSQKRKRSEYESERDLYKLERQMEMLKRNDVEMKLEPNKITNKK